MTAAPRFALDVVSRGPGDPDAVVAVVVVRLLGAGRMQVVMAQRQRFMLN